MSDNKRNKGREVILAIAVSVISLVLYHWIGRGLRNVIKDEFLHDFVAELIFAIFVLISVLILKKTDIFKSDRALLKSGWKSAGFMIFMIIYVGFTGLGNLMEASVSFKQFLLLVGQLILVGFCEETLFRGLIQRAFHNYFGEDSRKHVIMAVVCSGIVFGLAHLINMDRDNPALAAVLQAGANCFMGMLYCAVFFRTGKNLKYLIFLHALYDFAAMASNGRLNGKSLSNVLNPSGDAITLQAVIIGILFWGVIYLIPTLIVLRPNKVEPLLSAEKTGEVNA